jgi:hypothetical protein
MTTTLKSKDSYAHATESYSQTTRCSVFRKEPPYGFIITRHVRDAMTNRYWNECVQSIRRFYQYPIVIVDDHSDSAFLQADREYVDVRIIDTPATFHGCGELLAFYYFYKEHWFENAVILHDSVFFQKRIRFLQTTTVLPLWHFSQNKNENKRRSLFLAEKLHGKDVIQEALMHSEPYQSLMLHSRNRNAWMGCFGMQCMIRHSFVELLQKKYGLFSLVPLIKTRADRCCLERILGVLFSLENPALRHYPSLFGNIYLWETWGLSYPAYKEILRRNPKSLKPLIKVWTGR